MCSSVCAHTKTKEGAGWFPLVVCLTPLGQGFQWITSLPFQPGQPASEFWSAPVTAPALLGLQECADMPSFLFGFWGFELRSSCLPSECSYSWGHLPSSSLVFDYSCRIFTNLWLEEGSGFVLMVKSEDQGWWAKSRNIGSLVLRWATGWLRRIRLEGHPASCRSAHWDPWKKESFCSRVIQPRQETRNICVSSTLSLSSGSLVLWAFLLFLSLLGIQRLDL